MAVYTHQPLDPALYAAGTELPANPSAVAWSAIWAGAIAAVAVTLVLGPLGAGFGLAKASVWPGVGMDAGQFTMRAGIWLIVMQWLSSLVGGYMAGRLRTRWQLHTDEVYFRDTAHGLLSWAVATVIVAIVAVIATTFAVPAALPVDALGADSSETVRAISPAAGEAARKAASLSSIIGAISLLVGALIASAAAVLGGRLRDKHP